MRGQATHWQPIMPATAWATVCISSPMTSRAKSSMPSMPASCTCCGGATSTTPTTTIPLPSTVSSHLKSPIGWCYTARWDDASWTSTATSRASLSGSKSGCRITSSTIKGTLSCMASVSSISREMWTSMQPSISSLGTCSFAHDTTPRSWTPGMTTANSSTRPTTPITSTIRSRGISHGFTR